MKPFYLALMLLLGFPAFSQIQGEAEVYLTGDFIDARFNGGDMGAFSNYIQSQFDYSKVKKPGKMVAAFTIDTEGKVRNIRITEIIDSESAMEMMRVLNLSPKWEPARRGGKPVSIDIKYPMVFKAKNG